MKILILVIGQLKNKSKYFSGFSLLELIVVISIISVMGIFVGISSNVLNLSNKDISIEKKLNSIAEEIIYLKNYSLSLRTPIELFALNSEKSSKIYFDKKSFELIGWETKDIYQNLVQTFISDIKINIEIEEKIFSIQRYIK